MAIRWQCENCGLESGPEAVYCPECGEAGPSLSAAPGATRYLNQLDEGESSRGDSLEATRTRPEGGSRSTLVGSSSGVAPSLLDHGSHHALMQSLPRQVRLNATGWTSLVGGWAELALCLATVPLIAVGVYAGGMVLGGLAGALLGIGGILLFVLLAFLYGAPETSRTLKGYRLARHGWAAGGEITRKYRSKGNFGDSYSVEFTFTDARGIIRRSRHAVTQEQWQGIESHQPITVLYHPEKPEECVIYEFLGLIAVVPARAALPTGSGHDRELSTVQSDSTEAFVHDRPHHQAPPDPGSRGFHDQSRAQSSDV